MMDKLRLMTIFIAVVDNEGFASAAKTLHTSAPSVTRAIAELEKGLGVKLLHRTTRHVRVTEAGQQYYQDAKRIVSLAEEAEEKVIGDSLEPKGHIIVTASVLFGRLYVMDTITSYLQRYPNVTIDAVFTDKVVNLMEDGVDIAVRIGALPDSSYQAIRVGTARRVICVSPHYLDQYGYPQSPEQLHQHRIILARGLNPTNELQFYQKGKSQHLKVTPYLTVSDNDSAAKAALAGLGVTRLLTYQIAQALQQGQLVTVLNAFEPPAVPVHIVHQEGRYASARMTALVDNLVTDLREKMTFNHSQ